VELVFEGGAAQIAHTSSSRVIGQFRPFRRLNGLIVKDGRKMPRNSPELAARSAPMGKGSHLMPRTIAQCLVCGEPAPLVSRGRCASCYMKQRRADDLMRAPRQDCRTRQKLRKAWCSLVCSAENLGLVDDDMEVLRVLVEPYTAELEPASPVEDEVNEVNELTAAVGQR
jgi:hypothetical protein